MDFHAGNFAFEYLNMTYIHQFLLFIWSTTSYEQIALGLLGVTAIRCSQDHRPQYQKLAPIFGLLGQPFWFIAMIKSQQWGVVVLCCFYTMAWWKGFARWYLPRKK